jgi:Protein of unknown function (DUF1403)
MGGLSHCASFGKGPEVAAGEGSAIAAAAAVAAVSLQKRPDADVLALWLADAVLAHRLKWPAPVPLIAGQIRRGDLRAVARPDGEGAWQTSWMLICSLGGRGCRLARRADQLLTAAPKCGGVSPPARSRFC